MTSTGVDAEAAALRSIRFKAFEPKTGLGLSGRAGTALTAGGALVLGRGASVTAFTDPATGVRRTYDVGVWTSPPTPIGFGATQAIASWDAGTPPGTFVEVALQARTTTGATTRWYVMGRWVSGDGSSDIRRASATAQADAFGKVATDTLESAKGVAFAALTLRVRLWRLRGSTTTPSLRLASWMASALPGSAPSTSRPIAAGLGVVLPVPAYSQMEHLGHYPKWNGGGEAWCSATSTAMVLDHWKKGPSGSLLSWVTVRPENRPQVDHVARCVYDYAYQGTGNWPFNTAYASARGLRSYVTRLRDLTEAQRFIAAGVPLIVSVSFTRAQLPQAGYGTNGHLMVVVGFTASGDVVVNDPASHLLNSDARVRNTYPRAAFERAWLGGSGGTVYVMAPIGRALPASNAQQPNWA